MARTTAQLGADVPLIFISMLPFLPYFILQAALLLNRLHLVCYAQHSQDGVTQKITAGPNRNHPEARSRRRGVSSILTLYKADMAEYHLHDILPSSPVCGYFDCQSFTSTVPISLFP